MFLLIFWRFNFNGDFTGMKKRLHLHEDNILKIDIRVLRHADINKQNENLVERMSWKYEYWKYLSLKKYKYMPRMNNENNVDNNIMIFTCDTV